MLDSKLVQGILTVASFIPPLSPFATVGRLASAAYQTYKGINNGNMVQTLMGVVSGATGLGKNAGMLGLSPKFANAMNKVSEYGQYGLSAYQAAKTGRLEDFPLALLNNVIPKARLGDIKNAVNLYNQARTVKNSLERGDELGAFNALTAMAGDRINDGSRLDKTLDKIKDIGGDVHAVQRALKQKDWAKVADLVMGDVKKYTRLTDKDLKRAHTALRLGKAVVTADQRFRARDWIGAGLGMAEAGHLLSRDETVRNKLVEFSHDMRQARQVFDALQNHRYDRALGKLNKMLGNPIAMEQWLAPGRQAGQNIRAIEKYIDAKDYDRAASQIVDTLRQWIPMEKNAVKKVRSVLDLADTVSDIVNKTQRNGSTGASGARSNAPAMVLRAPNASRAQDLGEKLELLQDIGAAIGNDCYRAALPRANQLLGKAWSEARWEQKLKGSIQTLERAKVAVDRHDWQQAAELTMAALSNYIGISQDTHADVNQLAKLFSAFDARFGDLSYLQAPTRPR